MKKSEVADIGITITPFRRSVMAMLDNKMFEGFCSSLLFLTAMIMNAFKRIVGSKAMAVMRPITKSKAEAPFSNRQKDLPLDKLVIVSVLFMSMLSSLEECFWFGCSDRLKLLHLRLLAVPPVNPKRKTLSLNEAYVSWLPSNKQLLDEVSVISRIIKVEVGVISEDAG